MTKTLTAVAVATAATITSAFATVAIDVQVGELRVSDLNGGGLVSDNTVAILVADTDNNGFDFVNTLNGISLTSGETIGSDDVILDVFQVNYTNGGAIVIDTASFELGSTFNSGDGLAFLWFDGITAINSTVTAGTDFGLISAQAANAGSGGDIGTSIPTDGTYTMAYFDNTLTANASGLDQTFFEANLTVAAVPEPSSTALLGLGSVALLLRRRR